MRRLYFDVCCLNRPFDDQTQPRIRLESEAVVILLAQVEDGDAEGVHSDIHDFEIARNPNADRRSRVEQLLRPMKIAAPLTPEITRRAKALESHGFKALDALHLASAEESGADIFLTTDDRLIKAAARAPGALNLAVKNPLTFVQEESLS